MLSEEQLIPYEASSLPPGPWLVFAPHPDDEVFGMGGSIARASAGGTRVEVVVVTAGDQAGDPAIRQQESEAAGKLIGVARLHFWDLPDRQLATAPLSLDALRRLVATLHPATIFLPGLQEYHPDHRALGLRLPSLLRQVGYDGGIWLYEISRHNEANRLLDISPVLARKQAAIRCFASQLSQNDYEGVVLGLNQSRAYTLPPEITHAEAFLETAKATPASLPAILATACRRYWQGITPDPQALVSLIVRTRNRPGLLVQALASIASQTYAQIEVVVVNDGGDAVDQAVASALAGRTYRIVDLPRNLGRPAAANAGLDAASGKYFGFLDDDDALDPDHVQHLVALQEERGGDTVVYAGVRGRRRDAAEGEGGIEFTTPEVSFAKLLFGNVLPIHAPLFPARLLAAGIRFDESLDLYEDWDFWLQLARVAGFVFSGRVTATYYLGGQSGVSPLAPSGMEVERGLGRLYGKWAQLIDAQQLRQMSALFQQVEGGSMALSRTIVEQELRINSLVGELAERDGRINGLVGEVAERDVRINTLVGEIAKRDGLLAGITAERDALLASTSWRLTLPVRFMGHQVKRLLHLGRLLPLLVARSGGVWPAMGKVAAVLRQGGVAGLRHHLQEGLGQADGQSDYLEWIRRHETLTDHDRQALQAEIAGFASQPLISMVMPVYNPKPQWLIEAIESVLAQLYPHWELCIADDASTDGAIRPILERYAGRDPRIRVVFRPSNGHIVEATNSALAQATGDFVGFLDHDDCLHPEALLEVVREILKDPAVDLLYTDEDKLSEDGVRCFPFLKPDWSPHLAVSQAYLGHLVCYRRSLLLSLGGLRKGFEGAQDYDLWLRASAEARQIVHLPRVLYHWRMHRGSTAMSADSKPYAHQVGRKAVAEYLHRRYPEQQPSVADGIDPFTYAASFTLPPELLVSIIIPTRDGLELLRPCIESIRSRSSWSNFEIIVLDNGSKDPQLLQYLRDMSEADARIRVVAADIPFNWSRLNNLGMQASQGEVVVFLNNDTEVITPGWLEYLAGYATLPDVGVVGGLLLFEDGTIQHSGVVVGMGGWADHVFRTQAAVHTGQGPFVSPVVTRNVLAVTGACMAVARDKFLAWGGFDEEFIICGSDVELCLRAHQQGYFNVMCAEARLFHLESKTRSPHIPEQDFRLSALHYEPYRTRQPDPFYHPSLSLQTTSPRLRE